MEKPKNTSYQKNEPKTDIKVEVDDEVEILDVVHAEDKKNNPFSTKSEKKLKRGSIRLSASEHLRSSATRSAQPRHQKIWAIFHAPTLPLTSKTIKLR